MHPHWALLLFEQSIYVHNGEHYILYRLKRRRDKIGMRLPVSPELPCNQMTQALLLFGVCLFVYWVYAGWGVLHLGGSQLHYMR